MAFNPKRLIPLVVIAALAGGGIWLDRVRSANHASLSGVWEAQPATLSSRVGGRVKAWLVEEGQFVKAGTPIAVIDAGPDQAQADAAEAQADSSRAQASLTEAGPRPEEITRQTAVVAEA
ncbi:MAG: biotin/lipoyl-binding protein [Armatimonadetes bacterium]|nr:biotin/lipoyl-binding protein [Armatimonadota bacterium]